ncbi:MAG TPA: fibronectin type III domain-containing protein [Bacteroidota bacterium]|nr:fibronectin type III domain-containing protein [Bacteroidota bacterium]
MRYALVLLCVPLSSSAAILMRPYLQAVTPTSVCVLIESDSPAPLTVRYGTTEDCSLTARSASYVVTTATPATYVHHVPLTGLRPETRYFYRGGEGTAFTDLSSFTTGALPGTPFRFVWVADSRGGTGVFDSIMALAAGAHPLLCLLGGDIAPTPSYESWKTGFFRPPMVSFGGTVPWVNAPGNHERWTTNTEAFTSGPVGAASQEYFSFDCGDMHVVVLNSELPLGPGTPQYEFADADLHRTNRTWKVVMLHKPAYCAGGHGEDSSVIALTSGVFERTGVALVLCGHSHFYQHNVVNGIHHCIIGSAGAPLYEPSRAWYTQKTVKEFNWAYADVTPSTLVLRVWNQRGAPLDTLVLTR